MNTKELSPAFLTSLLVIFIGALLISFNSSLTGWIGWVLILAGLALNVFSALLTIQGASVCLHLASNFFDSLMKTGGVT